MAEQSNGNGRFKLTPQAVITVVGWVVSILLAYGAVNARVSVLESRVSDFDSRMQRIEDKLDRIWERLK